MDVVTGKLDVREAAARLPDKEDYSELMDALDASGPDDGAGEDVDAGAEAAEV